MTRQALIMTAVWDVILTRGITGVSFRAVADAAGVSLGLVQHYHSSKDALIRASAQAMIAGALARYRALNVTTDEAIMELVAHRIPRTDRQRDGVVVWHAYLAACVTDPRLAELLREAETGQEAELARLLSERMSGGDATDAARGLIALADGLAARVVTTSLSSDEALSAATASIAALLASASRREGARR